jgi:acetyl-CoA carboxylase beta subunit
MEPATPTTPERQTDTEPAEVAPATAVGPRCFERGIDLSHDQRYHEVGVCGSCGARMAISASQWIDLLFDRDSLTNSSQD